MNEVLLLMMPYLDFIWCSFSGHLRTCLLPCVGALRIISEAADLSNGRIKELVRASVGGQDGGRGNIGARDRVRWR